MADGMLGRLARWLRIMGYDTAYPGTARDEQLLEMASRGRILLTADKELYAKAVRMGLTAHLVREREHVKRVADVVKHFKLPITPQEARCTLCNGELVWSEGGPRPGPAGEVPPMSASELWVCSSCGKFYWEGSHWRRIGETLRSVEELVNTGRERLEAPGRRAQGKG